MVKYFIHALAPRRYVIMCKVWYRPFKRFFLNGEYRSMDDVQEAIDELRDKETGE
jgi:hypothetical protein